MQYIAEFVLLFFVIVGMVEILRSLAMRIVLPPKGTNFMITIPLSEHREDAEYLIRAAVMNAKWMGHRNVHVAVIDCGMDEETIRICNRICQECKIVKIIKKEDFDADFYLQR